MVETRRQCHGFEAVTGSGFVLNDATLSQSYPADREYRTRTNTRQPVVITMETSVH